MVAVSEKQVSVAFVMVNYNTAQRVTMVYKNILEKNRRFGGVIKFFVIDNGSAAPERAVLQRFSSKVGDVELVFLKENLGYARANNIGLRLAADEGIDYCAIINSDIEFATDAFVEKFIAISEKREDCGLIGPATELPNGTRQIPHQKPSILNCVFPIQSTKEVISKAIWQSVKSFSRRCVASLMCETTKGLISKRENVELERVYATVGCCIFGKTELFATIGYLDEQTFLYREEYILAEKIRATGKVWYYADEIKVIHTHKRKTASIRDIIFHKRHEFRSTLYYFAAYLKYSELQTIVYSLLFVFKLVAYLMIFGLKRVVSDIRTWSMSGLKVSALIINGYMPMLHGAKVMFSGMNFLRGPIMFMTDLFRYNRMSNEECKFPLKIGNIYPQLYDRYDAAEHLTKHYFYQDIWAAQKVFQLKAKIHYDIGSRIDGFIAHCAVFCKVVCLDIRPMSAQLRNVAFMKVDASNMTAIESGTISSVSALHSFEHFGLGRYGDRVDPEAYHKAIDELKRIVRQGGNIYFSVPIGRQRVEFNAHRVFNPAYVLQLFEGCDLIEFSAIDDDGDYVTDVDPLDYVGARYSCGLFHFRKSQGPQCDEKA